MYTYSFEKLDVWQLSRKLVKQIYLLTRSFPDEEKFGMTSQLRRAAVSVRSNNNEKVSLLNAIIHDAKLSVGLTKKRAWSWMCGRSIFLS